MRLYHLSIAILAAALAACGTETAEAPAPQASDTPSVARPDVAVEGPERRILAFGDSLFAGYGVGEENSYPALLEDALREQGINARIANGGVSGDTSQAGAQRLAFTLDAQAEKPDLVLLELGGNDMLRGVSPDQTRASFEAMLGELRQRDIPVLLMKGARRRPCPNIRRNSTVSAGLASEYDAELIPFWLEAIYQDPSLFQSDRIHPTVEGIEALVADTADEVAAALPPVN